MNPEKFVITVNGGRKLNLTDNIAMGNYLMFLEDSPLYDTASLSNEESQQAFKKCFPGGFAWEVLEVFSGKGDAVYDCCKSRNGCVALQ